MSRLGVTRQEIFNAAQELIKKGRALTQDRVQDYLGKGSRGTIHKYLKQWKQTCFEQGTQGQHATAGGEKEVVQEKPRLEQALDKQTQLNKTLSHDLLVAEREIAKLREQSSVQQKELEALQQEGDILRRNYEKIQAAYEVTCLERDTVIEKIMEDKNRLIEKLHEELKETHQENLAQAREWSYQKEDALMQEKVKCLNYEEQIKALKEELKRMTTELIQARSSLEPLNREVTRQRKLVQEKGNVVAFGKNEASSSREEGTI